MKILMFIILFLPCENITNEKRLSLGLDVSLMKLWELLPESVKLFGSYFPHLQNQRFKLDWCSQKQEDCSWHKDEHFFFFTNYV